jgi:hypothetical protein
VLVSAVIGGEPVEAIARKAKNSLCQTLKKVQQQLPFDRFISAACNDPGALNDLIRGCDRGHEFAALFRQIVRPGMNEQEVCTAFVEAVCDKYFYQIESGAFPSERWSNPQELRSFLCDVREHEQMVNERIRIAKNLAKNPSKPIRMARSRNRKNLTPELLKGSLLGTGAK